MDSQKPKVNVADLLYKLLHNDKSLKDQDDETKKLYHHTSQQLTQFFIKYHMYQEFEKEMNEINKVLEK